MSHIVLLLNAELFAAVLTQQKRHDLRRGDFCVGDHVLYREFNFDLDTATGRWVLAQITYTEPGGKGIVLFSLDVLSHGVQLEVPTPVARPAA
jgi:hypothetical protein